ncbi:MULTISPECIES: hypothetical protein [Burkholderia]|jgi:hypothetical protein|uniref:Uncharacterized protein n=1 Tax=Burkholderia multivorans TaxID=87883 RepID=A0AAP2HIT5_9BURK|nr:MULTISPECIES: hypothetical protein [Burkholderia]EKS9915986.1 hypothetical protein [Burkholderia multivorans]MBH9661842.1 hypothetical protein [Burkholderia multivorans]MBJ9619505.1 hypothetical protein [Burkholderia multivorans]MBJ9685401.1 hypothetical protein [Burkholderia multivorans]MBN6729094.1 hypothetical protein [Burkholderia multivorans]
MRAQLVCCAAQSIYLDIDAAMVGSMLDRLKNPGVALDKMFYVSPKPLSRLFSADYCGVRMFGGLTHGFTWGKR